MRFRQIPELQTFKKSKLFLIFLLFFIPLKKRIKNLIDFISESLMSEKFFLGFFKNIETEFSIDFMGSQVVFEIKI